MFISFFMLCVIYCWLCKAKVRFVGNFHYDHDGGLWMYTPARKLLEFFLPNLKYRYIAFGVHWKIHCGNSLHPHRTPSFNKGHCYPWLDIIHAVLVELMSHRVLDSLLSLKCDWDVISNWNQMEFNKVDVHHLACITYENENNRRKIYLHFFYRKMILFTSSYGCSYLVCNECITVPHRKSSTQVTGNSHHPSFCRASPWCRVSYRCGVVMVTLITSMLARNCIGCMTNTVFILVTSHYGYRHL